MPFAAMSVGWEAALVIIRPDVIGAPPNDFGHDEFGMRAVP